MAQFYRVEFIVSESKELLILASRGIVVRAEKFIQRQGWFVAFALEHNTWLIYGSSRRYRWFVVFALEHGIVGYFLGQVVGIVGS